MSCKIEPSCDICKHCHPLKGCSLIEYRWRDKAFYCDHFEDVYCETTPCTTGYKKRRVGK